MWVVWVTRWDLQKFANPRSTPIITGVVHGWVELVHPNQNEAEALRRVYVAVVQNESYTSDQPSQNSLRAMMETVKMSLQPFPRPSTDDFQHLPTKKTKEQTTSRCSQMLWLSFVGKAK